MIEQLVILYLMIKVWRDKEMQILVKFGLVIFLTGLLPIM